MRQRLALAIAITLFALAFLFYFYYPPVSQMDPGQYNATTVTLTDANGTELERVDVRIAETRDQRIIGLSQTDSLENGSGMLFVHSEEDTQSYVMRNMSFPIDIIFIDAEGQVTEIHEAPLPEHTDNGAPYSGRAKYVLEVPYGWSAYVGLTEGDTVTIPDGVD